MNDISDKRKVEILMAAFTGFIMVTTGCTLEQAAESAARMCAITKNYYYPQETVSTVQ
jgi:hypothetical protein